MEIFLHPLVVIQFVIGCIVGVIPRRPILRNLSWLIVPPLFILPYTIANGLFTKSGEAGFYALMVIVILLPYSFLIYGIALALGRLLGKFFEYCARRNL
jgi:hypothetical protein